MWTLDDFFIEKNIKQKARGWIFEIFGYQAASKKYKNWLPHPKWSNFFLIFVLKSIRPPPKTKNFPINFECHFYVPKKHLFMRVCVCTYSEIKEKY